MKTIKVNKINSVKIYINTLIPYFHFKNKFGRIGMPIHHCSNL